MEAGNSPEKRKGKNKVIGGEIMANETEKTLYIGVDYHKKSFTVAYIDNLKEVLTLQKYRSEEMEKFKGHLKSFKEKGYKLKVAVETLTGVMHFTEEIMGLVDELRYVNTNKFKNVLKGVNNAKTDKIDAETIGIYYMMGLLPTVYVPSREEKELRLKLKERESYIEIRKGLMNRVHSVLLEYGIKIKNRELLTEKGKKRIKLEIEEKLPSYMKGMLLREIEVIEYMTEKIKESEKEIEVYIGEREELKEKVDKLKSIPGVGKIVAVSMVSVIGDEKRFSNGDKVASYIGLVPRVSSSGEREKNGRITKKGDSSLRNKLVQAANALIKSKTKNSLKEFYQRLIRKGISKQKAIIAVARKLAKVMYVVLKEGREFIDFVTNKRNLALTG